MKTRKLFAKLKNSKKVIIFDKLNNKEYLFNNYLDCINYFKFNKKTLFTYTLIGVALTETMALYVLVIVFIILFS
jgi:hypothetical protein